MTPPISLSPFDLSLAALLVIALAGTTFALDLGIGRQIAVAALRTVVQLSLVGLVLEALFAHPRWPFVLVMAAVMLLAAGREVQARQHRPLRALLGWTMGATSMFVSSFAVTILALTVMIGNTPWYDPRYAIPLLGMLLGNTMTGIAVAFDRLLDGAWNQRDVVEQRLLLGEPRGQAAADLRHAAARAGMIPILNAMAAAGIVSLPGMMTGQILAGNAPGEAVKYQILVMFLIAAGTGFGTLLAVALGARALFDERHRLRLDRLRLPRRSSHASPTAAGR